MSSNTDEEAMTQAIETIAEDLLKSAEFGDKDEEEDEAKSNDLQTYNDLKKAMSKSVDSTQFAKLEKTFPSSKSVLKHTLPGLFEIIDIISIRNIIYTKPELVNNLLNNVLFSGLTKLDNKLEGLYKKSTSEDKESNYIPLQITYNADDKSFEVQYPNFLADAFESIKHKIDKQEDYKIIVSITKNEDTVAGEEERVKEGYNIDAVAAVAATVV